MPLLFVQTNVPLNELPINLNDDLTYLVASIIRRPSHYVFVSIQYVPWLSFQGSAQPAALLELKAIDLESKRTAIERLTEYITETTNIPQLRIGVTIVDLKGPELGINGMTFGPE